MIEEKKKERKVKGMGESKGCKEIPLVLATWGVALVDSIGEGLDTRPDGRYSAATGERYCSVHSMEINRAEVLDTYRTASPQYRKYSAQQTRA
jgi:hypothetical protein